MHHSTQTRITIKNLKHFAAMSHETYCFTASVYWDGKKIGTVENPGHGGCHKYRVSRAVLEQVEEWIGANIDAYTEAGGDYAMTLNVDLDWIITDLITDQLTRKDLKRLLRNRIVAQKDGKIVNTQVIPGKVGTERFERIKARWIAEYESEGVRVLNTMPFDDALNTFRRWC
jgi:hypothetical protein